MKLTNTNVDNSIYDLEPEARQKILNHFHSHTKTLIEQYAAGLVTLAEFLNGINIRFTHAENLLLNNLIDPNTGLKYPNDENTEWRI